jgi:hypothetical protein
LNRSAVSIKKRAFPLLSRPKSRNRSTYEPSTKPADGDTTLSERYERNLCKERLDVAREEVIALLEEMARTH